MIAVCSVKMDTATYKLKLQLYIMLAVARNRPHPVCIGTSNAIMRQGLFDFYNDMPTRRYLISSRKKALENLLATRPDALNFNININSLTLSSDIFTLVY